MRVTYDPASDAAYIYLVNAIKRGEAKHQEIALEGGVVLDLGADGRLLGIEILRAGTLLVPRNSYVEAQRQPPSTSQSGTRPVTAGETPCSARSGPDSEVSSSTRPRKRLFVRPTRGVQTASVFGGKNLSSSMRTSKRRRPGARQRVRNRPVVIDSFSPSPGLLTSRNVPSSLYDLALR
jgi:uncharacterized protein YuzE